MALLQLRQDGQVLKEILLQQNQHYIVGRKSDCDIVLESHQGISREHLKILFEDHHWVAEVLSKYGDIYLNGQPTKKILLEHGSRFLVPPYEFYFLFSQAELPVVQTSSLSTAQVDQEEKTLVFSSGQYGVLILLDDKQENTLSKYELKGSDQWLCGRDHQCEVCIAHPMISRRQFEIKKIAEDFFITDLGSVNGTLLNGKTVSVVDPTSIKSGDIISIKDVHLRFEMHDGQFQSRLMNVQQQVPSVLQALPGEVSNFDPVAFQNTAAMPNSIVTKEKKFDFIKHRPKLIVGAVLILLFAFIFSDNSSSNTVSKAPQATLNQDPLALLEPEKKAMIQRTYELSKNYYIQGKYRMAKEEILKIKEHIPDYLDIAEIDKMASEALAIEEQNRRIVEIEKAKAEGEEKIQQQLKICKSKVRPQITMEEIESCLNPVLQFNPEHPDILHLKQNVENLVSLRLAKEVQKQAYQDQVQKLKSLYKKAEVLQSKNNPLEAIKIYQQVQKTGLPDPSGLKQKAQRQIASLKKQVNDKTASYQSKALQMYNSQNLKGAILALRQAKTVDPNNPDLQEKIDQYMIELRKQMMVLYQEGILEESFGNVEGSESKPGAKDKWKKIMILDVTDGEYYKKAYLKLKKYGAI
ncbi:MAG: FHA domain-containing protein [Pseudobdellovibrionaceae bacterium]